ncbi:hypothetical protein BV25DRAFT_1825295 [Artomyces pyxidatus]|uniref:Uncharacterized protein n=1 Tax=Artomyces pyxidatus TaxID=48021 RepID=A0ACB8T3M7_9AGAM|nr:hypothetical protein BV25DRAFT_1825295 [Artomyces pyxidatus]
MEASQLNLWYTCCVLSTCVGIRSTPRLQDILSLDTRAFGPLCRLWSCLSCYTLSRLRYTFFPTMLGFNIGRCTSLSSAPCPRFFSNGPPHAGCLRTALAHSVPRVSLLILQRTRPPARSSARLSSRFSQRALAVAWISQAHTRSPTSTSRSSVRPPSLP